ncbi:hypothetical protein NW759_017124 [Fusarium solani]|nr:hypothetical protein NW759_017124 [Fusarium solani]
MSNPKYTSKYPTLEEDIAAGRVIGDTSTLAFKIARKNWESYCVHDLDGLGDVYDENAIIVSPAGEIRGHPKAKAFSENWYKAFTNGHYELLRTYTAGEFTIHEFKWKEDHTGVFKLPGVPEKKPEGATFYSRGAQILQVKDGKIVREELYWDNLTFVQQVGYKVVP